MFRQIRLIATLSTIAIAAAFINIVSLSGNHFALADCNMPGTKHDDNHPSEKKGNQMIKSGASVCEVAKACDAMKIDVAIDNKKELHSTQMYKSAPDNVKEELDKYATHGHGHDNPNLTCYEVEYAAKE